MDNIGKSTGPSLHVRPATAADSETIARIYSHYILHTTISFEEQPVSGAEMGERMADVWSSSLPWLVAVHAGQVVAYACAGKWKERIGYRYSVETSVYVDQAFTGRRIGTQLYQALLPLLRDRAIHAVIGGIALPNAASVAMHERLGFRKVAHFKEVGYKFGQWIDVGYWQTSL